MRNKVRVAIAGVGNCASALVQGTIYYGRIQAHHLDHFRSNASQSSNIISRHDYNDHKKGNSSYEKVIKNNKNNDHDKDNSKRSSSYASTTAPSPYAPGLIAYSLGGIEPADIEFVAAFDVVE